MKKFFRLAAIAAGLLTCASLASAQSLAINVAWIPSSASSASNPGTVQVYRASGTCAANPTSGSTYSELTSSAPAADPYQDATPTAGQTYAYYVTATIPGYEASSLPSACVQVTDELSTGPAAPTGLTATVVSVSSSPAAAAKTTVRRPNPPGVQ